MANIGTNKGGKSFQDRVLASEVRSLALDEIKKVLTGDDEEYKKALEKLKKILKDNKQ